MICDNYTGKRYNVENSSQSYAKIRKIYKLVTTITNNLILLNYSKEKYTLIQTQKHKKTTKIKIDHFF